MKDSLTRKRIEELQIRIKDSEDKIGWLEGFISYHFFFEFNKRHPPLPHDLKTWSIPTKDNENK